MKEIISQILPLNFFKLELGVVIFIQHDNDTNFNYFNCGWNILFFHREYTLCMPLYLDLVIIQKTYC